MDRVLLLGSYGTPPNTGASKTPFFTKPSPPESVILTREMTDIPAELEAVAGPLKGSIIPLAEDEISIGREPLNQVSLLDAAV
jgi:hypothetical protein